MAATINISMLSSLTPLLYTVKKTTAQVTELLPSPPVPVPRIAALLSRGPNSLISANEISSILMKANLNSALSSFIKRLGQMFDTWHIPMWHHQLASLTKAIYNAVNRRDSKNALLMGPLAEGPGLEGFRTVADLSCKEAFTTNHGDHVATGPGQTNIQTRCPRWCR